MNLPFNAVRNTTILTVPAICVIVSLYHLIDTMIEKR